MNMEICLKDQTKAYWEISSIWLGRINRPLTVMTAIQGLNIVLKFTNPSRKLSDVAGNLMADIIKPKRTKKNKTLPPPTNLDDYRRQNIETKLQATG